MIKLFQINLLDDEYSITGDFYFAVKSPCGLNNKDKHCCAGRYNNPNMCGCNNEIKHYCNYVKRSVNPQHVYCYAHDDKDGAISVKNNYILITFWDTQYYNNKLI